MPGVSPEQYRYPSTRYSGSKRRLLPWIWDCIKDIKFASVLDVFGGTASTSLLFKRNGKKVHFNDLLQCNQTIGRALIENSRTKITISDLEFVFGTHLEWYPTFIQETFQGMYFLDHENIWLDKTVTNIGLIKNRTKRSMLLAALFQACLAKRPFNLFHRANLPIRTSSVKRTFGNKTTWEHPFEFLMTRFTNEYNSAVFCNGQKNKMIGGFDALASPNGVDLVYLDPPYIAPSWSEGTNYANMYHFLEGMVDYNSWGSRIDYSTKTRRLLADKSQNRFVCKTDAKLAFFELIDRFSDNILVISYRANGHPNLEEIRVKLKSLGKQVKVSERPYKYALSRSPETELLIVAT